MISLFLWLLVREGIEYSWVYSKLSNLCSTIYLRWNYANINRARWFSWAGRFHGRCSHMQWTSGSVPKDGWWEAVPTEYLSQVSSSYRGCGRNSCYFTGMNESTHTFCVCMIIIVQVLSLCGTSAEIRTDPKYGIHPIGPVTSRVLCVTCSVHISRVQTRKEDIRQFLMYRFIRKRLFLALDCWRPKSPPAHGDKGAGKYSKHWDLLTSVLLASLSESACVLWFQTKVLLRCLLPVEWVRVHH